jgi:hypothetical protein
MRHPQKRGRAAATAQTPAQPSESSASKPYRATQPPFKVFFETDNGERWYYTRKRARVLQMLATMQQGLTQHDCYPWHTRLGGTIHAMREDGLEIETVLEGEFRHARYFLRTKGRLAAQPENGKLAA